MNIGSCVAVLAAVLLLAMPAGAQSTDPEGDVMADLYDQQAPFPGGAAVDLTGFRVDELDATLRFVAILAGSSQQPPGAAWDAPEVDVWFHQGAVPYLLRMGVTMEGEPVGTLFQVDLIGPRTVTDLDVAWDGAGMLTTEAPRHVLLDEGGAPPRAGDEVGPFDVRSRSQFRPGGPDPDAGFFCCRDAVVLRDEMQAPALRIESGGRGGDGLVLDAADPFRLSNGGATTLVYTLEATNPSDRPIQATVTVERHPRYTVEHPLLPVTLEAGGTASFPIVVHTPDGHGHGDTDTFRVRLESETDGAAAWTDIGVRYAQVPQPAGHHDTLYFHSHPEATAIAPALEALGYRSGMVTMNTLPPADTDPAAPIDSTHSGFGETQAQWDLCLLPGLAMGLQFDVNETGTLSVPISAGRPYGDATLTGRLVRYDGGPRVCNSAAQQEANANETVLGTFAEVPFDPSASPTVESLFTPNAARVPYAPGGVLMLELVASFTDPDSQGPGPLVVLPGGSVRLPLMEYADAPPLIVFEKPAPQPIVPPPVEQQPVDPVEEDAGIPSVGVAAALAVLAVAAIAASRRRQIS